MITDDQKKQIITQVRDFQEKVAAYCSIKERVEKLQSGIASRNIELKNVAEEERQIETAVDVLYRQTKKVSRAKEIQIEIDASLTEVKKLTETLNKLDAELLSDMRNLPIPVDLREPSFQNKRVYFPYFENSELTKETLNVMASLLRREDIIFDDVSILPENVVIDNTTDIQDAIQKLVEAVQNLRNLVDDFSRSYEKIDELIERLIKSKVYPNILKILAQKKKLSIQEIAKELCIEERVVYDGCYNLTRSTWSPNPVRKTSSGEWELTLTGEILVKRLLEKYEGEMTETAI